MYRFCINLFTFLFLWSSSAEILRPVQWTCEKIKKSENEYEILVKAHIQKDWYVYSKNKKLKDIGVPVSLNFSEDKTHYEKIGPTEEIGELKKKNFTDLGFISHIFKNNVIYKQRIHKLSSAPFQINVLLEFQACSSFCCLAPEKLDFVFYFNGDKKPGKLLSEGREKPKEPISLFDQKQKIRSINILFIGFLSGLAAVFMPCIFPMIPLTISLFSKESKSRFKSVKKALFYGACIISIYVFLGIFASLIFGASFLNELSTNPWINFFFFFLFICFAFSFFGLFEISLSGSWINAVDKKSRGGGLSNIFFMAFVLVLVSFSCTAPIIGTLLVEVASGGGLLNPIIGMFGFSLGLSLPFIGFAIFPSRLKSLPRSGEWLKILKVSFGFIELALAMKFLSNADLVWQWHLVNREVFLVFWFIIFFLLACYLFRAFFFYSNHSGGNVRFPIFFMAIFSFGFSLYTLSGLFGAPLRLLSGFIPPSIYTESSRSSFTSPFFLLEIQKGPHGIPVFYDYNQGRNYAMKKFKPILLDFTGYSCANCRKMEEKIWSDPLIKCLLSKEIVVISLRVDDRRKLPESEWYFSNYLKRKVTTYGQKWIDFQMKYFKTNAQPYYIIVDYQNQLMNESIGVQFNVHKYTKWLKSGIHFFHLM